MFYTSISTRFLEQKYQLFLLTLHIQNRERENKTKRLGFH